MTAIGERYVRARKRHICESCSRIIEPGEVYRLAKTPPSDEFWPGHWNTWRQHNPPLPARSPTIQRGRRDVIRCTAHNPDVNVPAFYVWHTPSGNVFPLCEACTWDWIRRAAEDADDLMRPWRIDRLRGTDGEQ